MARSTAKAKAKAATTAGTGFAGFRPAAFAFFRGLRDNNDPDWFKPRKAVYETEVLAPFRALIAAVTAALAEAGIPLAGDPRAASSGSTAMCAFRPTSGSTRRMPGRC